jgi:hypothetical protein
MITEIRCAALMSISCYLIAHTLWLCDFCLMTRFSNLETYGDLNNVVCARKMIIMCSMQYIFLHSG